MLASEGGIYCTYGYFGTYKTLGNAYLIIEKLKAGHIVFSNIKMNTSLLINKHNFYYFDDIKTLADDILPFSALFAQSVSNYNEKSFLNNEPTFMRGYRPQIDVVFDEMGIFGNATEYKKFNEEVGTDLTQYLLQIRKLFVNIYLIIQKPSKLVKQIRDYVQYWIKPKPTFEDYPFINFFTKNKCISYYYQVLDDETFKVDFDIELHLDNDGDYYEIKKPLEWLFFRIWYVPFYFKFYDDLYVHFKNDIIIKTKYLRRVGFFNNLYNGNLKSPALIDNIKIYNEYIENSDKVALISGENIKNYKEPRFIDNPFYYIHKFNERGGFLGFLKRYFKRFLKN